MIWRVAGNRLTLLANGAEFFPALEAACDAARREIRLETYIFADDATGRRIVEALGRAARRGVAVRVLVDGFGSQEMLAGRLGADLRDAGVRLLVYRPETARRLRRYRLRRLHRKLAVCDGELAFVGGINIVDDADAPGEAPRFDYAVRVEGPLVAEIVVVMERLWRLVAWTPLRRRGPRLPVRPHPPPPRGEQSAAFVIRDNLRHRRAIEDAYLEAIGAAQTEIVIANAYFFPGRRFRHALVAAARRGVRVVLLLQGRIEYLLQHYATRALYGQLLAAGIEIHEYHRSFLHAKAAVVDAHWATVGSSNIDPFSLLLAREANIVVGDPRFVVELRSSLDAEIAQHAVRVAPEQWERQPLPQRIATWLCYGIARALMGMTGYARTEEFG